MAQCNPTPEEIASLVDALETASMMMSSQNYDEDVVIFLGTTKAGKSTLINFLLGNELLGEQLSPSCRFLSERSIMTVDQLLVKVPLPRL